MTDRVVLADAYFSEPRRYLAGNHRVRLRAEIVKDMLGDLASAEILDLGCGDGAVAQAILSPGSRAVLVDKSPAMVFEAKKRVPTARCVQADLESYRGSPADVVLALGVLAHINANDMALDSISRNLKPGGLCVIQLSDSRRLVNRLSGLVFGLRNILQKDAPRYRRTSKRDLIHAARRYGLKLIEQRNHLLIFPGLQRLLGPLLVPYDRMIQKAPWLAKHGMDTLLLFRKA